MLKEEIGTKRDSATEKYSILAPMQKKLDDCRPMLRVVFGLSPPPPSQDTAIISFIKYVYVYWDASHS